MDSLLGAINWALNPFLAATLIHTHTVRESDCTVLFNALYLEK